MEFNIDLTKVPDIKPLPSGVYVIRMVEGKQKVSSKGNNMIAWQAEVLQPEHIAQNIPKWFFFSSLVENALFRLKQLYGAAECLHEGNFSIDEILGREIGVSVTLEEGDNGLFNQIHGFYRVSEVDPKVEPEEIEKAAALEEKIKTQPKTKSSVGEVFG